MRVTVTMLFLVLPLMSFLSSAVSPEKEEKQGAAVETVSSVIIDNSKKIISEFGVCSLPTIPKLFEMYRRKSLHLSMLIYTDLTILVVEKKT